ncbi:dolichyl-diphosphooligosaccharide-protein glycotransferase [Pseudohyphozyma bogoriensis]|nr:dolichyl-diphosphooligosaccharide-protein glycotransferase [Pseudohyphozyma bogoriensis]
MRISTLATALVAFVLPAIASAAVPPPRPRLAVVTDKSIHKDDYSHFWSSLEERGYDLTFRSAQETQPELSNIDDLSFDHLILFAPTTKNLPADLSPQALFSYVEQSRNVLVVLSPSLTEFWRDLSREFDLDFDDRGNQVIDHVHYDHSLDDGSHTTLVVPLSDSPAPFISQSTRAGAPILYNGIGHEVGRQPLLTNVLHARSTAYSFDTQTSEPPTEDTFLSGSQTGLVSSFQARNNARLSFVGSTDVFSDKFVNAGVQSADGVAYSKSGNADFIADLTRWTFHETGVLRVASSSLSRARDGAVLDLYRVKEELDFTLHLESLEDGVWRPITPSDVQFEFTMLDPHLLLPLSVSPTDPTALHSRFIAPDRHGVFSLKVDYRRPGLTFVEDKIVVSVTPPRHDEYDRYIIGALPYYGSAFSVSAATLLFVVLWSLQ